MRITLSKEELGDLAYILYEVDPSSEHSDRAVELVKRLSHEEEKYLNSITQKKKAATKTANKAKHEKSRKLIRVAIKALEDKDKKITLYSVSKTAKISYNTAKRHENYISELSNSTQDV